MTIKEGPMNSLKFAAVLCALCGLAGCNSGGSTTSTNSTNPTSANGSGTSACLSDPTCKANALTGIAYGVGVYITVGGGGPGGAGGNPWMETSTDGVTWKQVDSGDTASKCLDQIVYGTGGFVVLDCDGNLLHSAGGTTWTTAWTKADIPAGQFPAVPQFLSWDGKEYLACGPSQAGSGFAPYIQSTDGKTWNYNNSLYATTGGAHAVCPIMNGNGLYVSAWDSAGVQAGTFATSTDMVNWSSYTVSFMPNGWFDLLYGNGQFVVSGANGLFATSTDGKTWTNDSISISGTAAQSTFEHLAFNGSVYVGLGDCNFVAYSADGSTWATADLSSTEPANAFAPCGGPGSVSGSATAQFKAITAAPGGAFVAIGGSVNGPIGVTSMDGIHWATSNP